MIEHEKHNNNKSAMEKKITEKRTISNSMKCWWNQTLNNTVCYYQTPFNVAVILEQMSNYNNTLRA